MHKYQDHSNLSISLNMEESQETAYHNNWKQEETTCLALSKVKNICLTALLEFTN